MNSVTDHDYLLQRAARERAIADACEDKAIALAHRRMADEYERRVRELAPVLTQVA